MNKDWGKAIAQLCVIIQNNADSKEPVLQYTEFMKTVYGIDGADFLDIYREWERSGEIVDKREKVFRYFPLCFIVRSGGRKYGKELVSEEYGRAVLAI